LVLEGGHPVSVPIVMYDMRLSFQGRGLPKFSYRFCAQTTTGPSEKFRGLEPLQFRRSFATESDRFWDDCLTCSYAFVERLRRRRRMLLHNALDDVDWTLRARVSQSYVEHAECVWSNQSACRALTSYYRIPCGRKL